MFESDKFLFLKMEKTFKNLLQLYLIIIILVLFLYQKTNTQESKKLQKLKIKKRIVFKLKNIK